MKLFMHLKITFKGMIKNGVATVSMFILFPVILAGFMGFLNDSIGENPLKLKQLDIKVMDEDNSSSSLALIDFLKSEDINELIKVTDDGDADLIISKGYEESVLAQENNKIKIIEKEDGHMVISTLKVILDNYHKNVYMSISGGNLEELNKINSAKIIENTMIDSKEDMNSYEIMASSMSAFVISMLILTFIQGSYTDISKNLDRRIKATPISRVRYFIYDYIALFCYSFIIVLCYTTFFRFAGIAFRGNPLSLIAIVTTAAALISSLSKFVYYLFGEVYGKVVGMALFILPVIGMEMFTGEEVNVIAKLAPTHYISKALEMFNLNGNIAEVKTELLIIIGVSLLLFTIVVIKESLSKGAKKCA
ncbi:ABC transporter permease [Clostridium vincentii]|uniref:ABC-2 family transporter protein n=1 Tax=Clostridium vincentii TaxID=52704 RepID=A0A2T0BD76_9CLOT|nr:ABC transporter permease [Clostridium vincentii]PRR81838.1 ABC-2 family transporter protein [Clostridium vincentii]